MKTLIKILCLSVLWFSCESSTEPQDVHGCLDSQACNYNSNANIDNNSCIYEFDCLGECGGDANEDYCGNCEGQELEWVQLWGDCYNIETTTELILHSNTTISGEIPAEIGTLINLTYLKIGYNPLTGEIPSEIGALTNLIYLEISDTGITGEIPVEIGNLTNLNNLILHSNQLTGEIPSEIWNLTNLEHLDLSNNDFTGEIPPEIGNLVNLTHLILNRNQLSGEIPAEIGNLTNLTHLSLYSNQLTGEIPVEICNQGDSTPNVESNQLCPPYPSCISQSDIDSQDISNCDGFTFCECPDEDCDNDNQLCSNLNLEFLNQLITENNMNYDNPLDIGTQVWNNGRLIDLFIVEDLGITVIPDNIQDLNNLERLHIERNMLTSLPNSITILNNLEVLSFTFNLLNDLPNNLCDLNLNWSDANSFNIYSNYICPPYPECVEDYIGNQIGEQNYQDTSNCP